MWGILLLVPIMGWVAEAGPDCSLVSGTAMEGTDAVNPPSRPDSCIFRVGLKLSSGSNKVHWRNHDDAISECDTLVNSSALSGYRGRLAIFPDKATYDEVAGEGF